MNFLAHIYLSGNSEEIKIGNFIADFVKSNTSGYSTEILAGINLHRKIDSFTDQHPIVRVSKERLYSKYHKYSGVIVDVFYDHFLAANWTDYHSENTLQAYSLDFYKLLNHQLSYLPERVGMMLPYMEKENWLLSYASIEGVNKALTGMSRRTKFHSGMETAANDLRENYQDFERDFIDFFPELKIYAKAELERVILI